ncbi:MAG: 5'/3'-nucleotidase SurE [Rhodothermales bacterium]
MEHPHTESRKRPLILVCNDDGIDAPGLAALAAAMTELGEVYVVAPLHEQSAVGHAITVRDPVRARAVGLGIEGATDAFGVQGTPADCVKLAVNQLLPRRPDLVVSGINRGPNTAVNVIYSGTVSAATEAAILGIDSVAISLCDWEGGDYGPSQDVARVVAKRIFARGLPPGILLNVNVPAVPGDEIKGFRATRQARARWIESFHERVDPNNRPYYWLTGTFENLDDGENTDLTAVEEGFVSVTPIQYDLTAHDFLDELSRWEW